LQKQLSDLSNLLPEGVFEKDFSILILLEVLKHRNGFAPPDKNLCKFTNVSKMILKMSYFFKKRYKKFLLKTITVYTT